MIFRLILALALLVCCQSAVLAQTDAAPAAGTAVRNAPAALQTLETLQIAISNLREQLREQRERLAQAETAAEQLAITRNIDDLATRMNQLEVDFRGVATGIDLADFMTAAERDFEWQRQLQELLQPLLTEMQQATSESREMEALRRVVAELENRRALARRAGANVADLLARTEDAQLSEALRQELATWENYLAETQGKLEAAQYQLAERQAGDPGVFNRISRALAKFFRSRGMNLLMAVAIFIGVIVISRKLWSLLQKKTSPQHQTEFGFSVRLLNLIFYALVIIGALLAALVSLYLADDWVLLTLAVIFLIAIAWGLKNTIPSMIEQIRILLNLGSIRQGERVIYNGLPWKVGSLNFFTNFTNPALEGALVRLPIRELQPMISRPCATGELWFPSEKEEWVLLDDKTFGKVVQQNPDFVQLIQLGGARKTYRTSEFLDQNPKNLSHNFRVCVSFGIDYSHQEIATTEVPQILQTEIQKALIELIGADALLSLKVEFAAAATSSLDYEIIADFAGASAFRYRYLERALQRLAVDSCNRHGWIIPFTQITLHRGKS